MKRKSNITIGLLAVSLILSGSLSLLAEIKNENLVPNGSFEISTDTKLPDKWRVSGKNGTVTYDTKKKKVGNASICVDLKSGSGEKRGIGACSERFKVEGGKLYLLTFNYLAKGFNTDKNKYLGASGSGRVIFYNAGKKQVKSLTFGLPYRNTKGWEKAVFCINPPKDAVMAEIYFSLGTGKSSVTPTAWFDDFRVREWIPGKNSIGKFNYGVGHAYKAAELVVDRSLHSKYEYKVIKSDKKKHKKGLAVEFGDPGLFPGEYSVIFRLKVDDNSTDEPVCKLSSRSQGLCGTMNTRTIKANEFKKPNTYQEFSYDFIVPCSGYVQHYVKWEGKVNCQVDYLTVIQRKYYTPEDFKRLWPTEEDSKQ